MPRYFFHLQAEEHRANPDTAGQHLPSPEAAWNAAQRIARQLLAWSQCRGSTTTSRSQPMQARSCVSGPSLTWSSVRSS